MKEVSLVKNYTPKKYQQHASYPHSQISKNKMVLGISFTIITFYMVVEFLGGYWFNSLTLMADAGHMANDSLSIFLAWIGLFLSLKWQKWLALINGISLVWVAIWIFIEAVTRWQAPIEIAALPMLGIALLGFGINLLVAFIMLKSNRHNLNIRAAYLHVLVDLFGSVVAIIAGISAWWLNWQWVDVVASGILSIFVLHSGISTVFQAIKSLYSSDDNSLPNDHSH
ncbi:cation diffusion facilitator family transporter [Haemophilus influenzae]|uniref:Cadmium, cobalt and zinc/H(+)-K(+) antiporter n=1 Tax=Haemophilus influenzae TaxID=727 RepID=A0AB37B5I8_HAEIF|nr:cation diffusion facilitator family transporter [Haemophilus influenzae]MCK9140676.1 cation diffusion facilitator family transporter [Haemophilus influenzae]PRJ25588.1 Cadmium, cobalt and zinc/H(+)-K(+) antiporter [Haemophilus influenzae]PRJ69329.1 Cadmium, cobalt and zinc/H(+)-K(+) antiporter [Haemophilus influenzae]PRM84202.1 Cadmium, cobalt and zinc/H(+)-K(+) antiporter [Haemophilus influenzae]